MNIFSTPPPDGYFFTIRSVSLAKPNVDPYGRAHAATGQSCEKFASISRAAQSDPSSHGWVESCASMLSRSFRPVDTVRAQGRVRGEGREAGKELGGKREKSREGGGWSMITHHCGRDSRTVGNCKLGVCECAGLIAVGVVDGHVETLVVPL